MIRLEWLYVSNCNTLLPLLCVYGIPMAFYLCSGLFFVFGFWVASKSTKFRINSMILALYPILFHFFFTVMVIFGHRIIFLKSHCGMVCIMILFVGAVH